MQPLAMDEEMSSPTDCSEDSVEIRSPKPIIRPNAILATQPAAMTQSAAHKRRDRWTSTDHSPLVPEEKRRRISDTNLPLLASIYPGAVVHPATLDLHHWMASRLIPHPHHFYPFLHPHPPVPFLHHPPPPPPTFLSPFVALPHPSSIYQSAFSIQPDVSSINSGRKSPPLLKSPPPAVVSPPPPPPPPPKSNATTRTTTKRTNKKLPAEPKVKTTLPPSPPAAAAPTTSFLSVSTLLNRDEGPSADVVDVHQEPEDHQTQSIGSVGGRNYKNMTRERRMQANARERTRVHTISAAFEALRKAVPSFSHGQRLSKLSILRVASAYIAALGQLADADGDDENSNQEINVDSTLDQCVDLCTRTLMTEGQLLRRKRPGTTTLSTPAAAGGGGRQQQSDDEDDEIDDI